jgi:hypothetical protein
VLPPKITSNTKKHYYMHPNANNPRRPPALGYTFMSLLSLVQEYYPESLSTKEGKKRGGKGVSFRESKNNPKP